MGFFEDAIKRPLTKAESDFEGNLREAASMLQPKHREEGAHWYEASNLFTKEQAKKHGVSEEMSSGLMSALSVGSSYEGNKKEHENILSDLKSGKPFRYGTTHIRFAWAKRIIEGEKPDAVFGHSEKVGPYHRARSGDKSALVLDRHAFRTTTRGARDRLRGKERQRASDAWFKVAEEHKMEPAIFQASLWSYERDKPRPKKVAAPKQQHVLFAKRSRGASRG